MNESVVVDNCCWLDSSAPRSMIVIENCSMHHIHLSLTYMSCEDRPCECLSTASSPPLLPSCHMSPGPTTLDHDDHPWCLLRSFAAWFNNVSLRLVSQLFALEIENLSRERGEIWLIANDRYIVVIRPESRISDYRPYNWLTTTMIVGRVQVVVGRVCFFSFLSVGEQQKKLILTRTHFDSRITERRPKDWNRC